MKKVYISGKISGLPRKEAEANFKRAEKYLRKLGFVTYSPLCLPKGFEWEDYMFIDLAVLNRCDHIYMLKGWEESKGARIERRYAIENGKHVIYESEKMSKRLSEQIRNDL